MPPHTSAKPANKQSAPPAPVVQIGAVFNCRADGQKRVLSHPQAFPHSSDELSEGPYMQPMNLKALRSMRPCAAMPRRYLTRARPARTADANHQRQTPMPFVDFCTELKELRLHGARPRPVPSLPELLRHISIVSAQ